ncbi:MAG TPA: helicase HerA-like domain-containing protein [Thermoplasmata archaeon]|nr:helicase HerA-like domain-containing protein [Thermoplasmata archaeon]
MPLHLGTNPETGAPIRLPEEDLLRHVVILGATGSGKTVLGKAILEEAVRVGVPVIAVDSQGDLASLALAATQESSAAHGTPDDARDEYWARAAVQILTPGSRHGVTRSLNPLKDAPAFEASEDAVLFVDAIAEGLAAAMGYALTSDSGSRAKDTIYMALQDAWQSGRWPKEVSDLPHLLERETAMDSALVSHKERAGLVRRAKAMTVGAKGLLFTAGPPLDVADMVSWAPKGRTPVNVVYTGGLRSPSEREMVVATLCEDVYRWMVSETNGGLRLVLYIDEVAGLCPPHPKNPPAKKFLSLLFRQARKYGVGLVVATQNVTDLDYKALGQANTWALGRLLAKQDLDRVRHLVGSLHPSDPEEVLALVPSLKAGQFLLLSPEHLGRVERLEVRGLATQHTVVPEERFHEIQSSHELALPKTAPDEKAFKRQTLAAVAAKAARSAAKTEVEEGIGLRVLHLFEDHPGIYGLEEIAGMNPADTRFLGILLRKLAEVRLLRPEQVEGREVYWDPTIGFDVRRGVPSRVAWLPLRFPLVEATKRANEAIQRRMLLIPREHIAGKEFYFVPLWRVEAEILRGRRRGRVARSFFVNAVSGHLAYVVNGNLSFHEFPREDVSRLDALASKAQLEPGPAQKIGDVVPVAHIGPSQAKEIVHRSLGAKVLTEHPDLCLLPIWKFEMQSNGSGRTRPVWVDGTLGSVLHQAPESR